ncbi:hypothetical protein [Xylanibacter muris]|uniref:Glycerophosphoryl diester phosphodiesterase membrane domain-containing protein n=1 Tax=Xylanibacter muris TaxID=2736290 RepID=A0ABX2AM51_9BACT|nr:hypothetical protein [Xylanibacter muris]NPD91304.1 hypothetical protein [Xylanibacter muris]
MKIMDKNMSENTTETIFKDRTYSGSLKFGYGLMASNFITILKASWPFAMLFSIILSAICTILPTIYTSPDRLWIIAVLLFAGGLAETACYSGCVRLLTEYSQNNRMTRPRNWLTFNPQIFFRVLKAAIFMLLMTVFTATQTGACGYALTRLAGTELKPSPALTALALAIVFINFMIIIPATYPAMKYVMEKDTAFLPLMARHYRTGMRHFGFIMAIILVNIIIISVIGILLLQPLWIVSAANIQAYSGLAMGDSLGMPAYVMPVAFTVYTVAGFIQIYLRVSAIVNTCVMYGAIETGEASRLKAQQ